MRLSRLLDRARRVPHALQYLIGFLVVSVLVFGGSLVVGVMRFM